MGAKYQHCAILVRMPACHELQVLEASVDGVTHFDLEWVCDACSWAKRAEKFNCICIRRLLVRGAPLDTQRRYKLRQYAQSVLGRAYEENPLTIVQSYLGIRGADDQSTLFCSELVAGALKAMGLLPASRAASDFLPSDFTHRWRHRLPLCGGAKL